MAAEELFDVCDEWGRPLGRRKARSLVHRDGDWHRSFHCWLVDTDDANESSLLLQRRALDKDTNPGLWDVSVAGHYAAGEGVEGGLREIREEIGLHVEERELVLAGWRREEVFYENGLIEREVQDVYFLARRIHLLSLRPDLAEVIAVARLPTAIFVSLTSGLLNEVTVRSGLVDERGRVRLQDVALALGDVVQRADGYYARVADFAGRLGTGQTTAPTWW